jgi:hypothetical protein
MKRIVFLLALIALAFSTFAQSYSNGSFLSVDGVAKDSTISATTPKIGGNYAVNYTAIVTADTTAITSASVKFITIVKGSIDGINYGEFERDTLNADGSSTGSTTVGVGSVLLSSSYPVNAKYLKLEVQTIDSTATATYTGQIQWSKEK